MFKQIKSCVREKTNMTLIITIACLVVSLACFMATGKKENVGTEIADDIIKTETGIDLEKVLPDDKTSSPVTP